MLMGCLMGNAWVSVFSGRPIGMSMPVWNVLLIVSFLMIWRRDMGKSRPGDAWRSGFDWRGSCC